LFCVLVSPAFAAPTITVTPGDLVNASGNREWIVQVTPDAAELPTALAVELPFTHQAGDSTLGVGIVDNAANDTNIAAGQSANDTWYYKTNSGAYVDPTPGPSNGVWVAVDEDDPLTPGVDETDTQNPGNNPFTAGITNGLYTSGANLFASLGSVLFTTAGAKNTLHIVTQGGGGILHLGDAIIAQEVGAGEQIFPIAPKNYYVPGDFDGNGVVGTPDFDLLSFNYGGAAPPAWDGFQPEGATVGTADFDNMSFNYGAGSSFGSGGGGVSAIPEPTSVMLLAAAGLLGLGAGRRRIR
jgi:hypothetical protein